MKKTTQHMIPVAGLLLLTATTSAQVRTDTTVKVPPKVAYTQDGVVDAGYRKLYRRQLSSAIASVSSESTDNLIVPNIKAALQGKVAGLHTIQSNGGPVSEVTVRLRGTASLYGESEPLYVIDGVPLYSGPRDLPGAGIGGNWGSVYNPLSDINPADIQRIDVLKDAAATAIYGARGGNGVILITTRQAVVNRQDVRVDYYNGVTQATNTRNVMSGPQYLAALDKAWQNSGNTGNGPLPAIAGLDRALAEATNTDQLGDVLRHGNVQQLSASAAYGTAKSAFYFSGSYRNEKGILVGNDYRRYTGRVKMTNQLNNRLTIGANIGIHFTDYFNMPTGYAPGGGFNAAQLNLPVIPYYNANKTYFYASDAAVYNLPGTHVKAFQSKNDWDNEENARRMSIAANMSYKIATGLEARIEAAMDQYQHIRRDYLSRRMRYGSVGSGTGREGTPQAWAAYEKYRKDVYNLNATLSYNRAKGDHLLNAVAGAEFYYTENPFFFAEGESFVSDFLRQPAAAAYRNQTTAQAITTNTNAVLGFFATANYTYKEKYMLGATVRVDASSRFGADEKYQVYPALSAGYWLANNQRGALNQLKLRASYGWSGNYQVGNYSSLETWGVSATSRYLLQSGVHALGLGSPSLKPERMEQFNLGADFAVLGNRLSGSLDIYSRTTKDMVLLFPVPLSGGVVNPDLLLNGGSMRNQGIELSLTSRNLTGALQWTTELSIAHNKNKILDLAGLAPEQVSAHPNIVNYTGHAAGVYYLAEYAGIDPNTGAELIYDANRNIVPATSAQQIDAARVPQFSKPSMPKWYGGLNNSLAYRHFDLSAFVTFSYGNYVLDEGERALSYLRGKNNLLATAADGNFPRLLYNDPIAGSNTTRFLHDASYLRMKNISLGYSFRNSLPKIKFLKEVRVYVSAQNLFTLTSFPGWDPEVSGSFQSAIERNGHTGVTYMDLPQVKSFVAGINVRL